MITAQDLRLIEGKLCVQDLKIAERLGFEAPYRIRGLIKRKEERLSKRGPVLTTVVKTSDAGGRPGIEYWLTKWQAIKICMWSEAPNADLVQDEIADVFDAYTDGKLVPPGQAPVTTEVLGHVFAIRKTVESTYKIAEGTQGKVIELVQGQARIEQVVNRTNEKIDDLGPQRKYFSEPNKWKMRYTVMRACQYSCPCGCWPPKRIVDLKGNPLLDEDGNPLLEYDHNHGRQKNGIADGWPVHRDCHKLLGDDDVRKSKQPDYTVFHRKRVALQGEMRTLNTGSRKPKAYHCPITKDMFGTRK